MRGLTILVAGADGERLHAALSFAAASAAMGAATGAATRLHLHGRAVGLLAPPIAMPGDADHTAAGLPTLAQILEDALDLGVAISACQSGLALAGLAADALDPRIAMDGPVGVLLAAGDDRLVTF